jgi:hypothetical protein
VTSTSGSGQRWQVEQVLALASSPSTLAAAQPLAVPSRWNGTGCHGRAVWGRCSGTSAEPYETVVDHVAVATRCSCPSRISPCKHALALLLLWARGQVAQLPEAAESSFARSWLATRVVAEPEVAAADAQPASPASSPAPVDDAGSSASAPPPRDPTAGRDDRVALMVAGLTELDRWLDDRLRTGLADPSLAQYRTWDHLAARLVDAQVGGLANRVRRIAGLVGAHPDWHQRVLAELGMLHLLAVGGRHLGELPPELADSVAAAIGWQVRQADVLAGVPITDHWVVAGRSDVREDRIEVRRIWLRGVTTGQWAMVLSFAAYQQSLDDSLEVGAQVHADVFRYPGAVALRVLVGRRHGDPTAADPPPTLSLADACTSVGSAVAREPWLERYPVTVLAVPARSGRQWHLTDHTGSLPLAEGIAGIATLLACSSGAPVALTVEWTPWGLVPLTVHLHDRSIDIGPLADSSFVVAAS